MFRTRTLFVVGAGASAEAHLPTGPKLAKTISTKLDARWSGGQFEGPGDRFLMGNFCDRNRVSKPEYQKAAWLIRDGVLLTNSIDDFLDIHNENEMVQRVGKATIVKSVLEAERESLLYFDQNERGGRFTVDRIEGTWFIRFFRMLGRGVSLSNARQIFDSVAFIVFNYDRCLEFFLLNALQLVFSIPLPDAASIINDLTIIHPYGVVATLPHTKGASEQVPFGGMKDWDYDYMTLGQGIRTYTEQVADADMLNEIQVEVARAERIVFLGFGYHDQNLRMLMPGKKLPLKPVFGTAFHMSESDITVIRNQLADMFAGSRIGVLPNMNVTDRSSASLFEYYTKTLPT